LHKIKYTIKNIKSEFKIKEKICSHFFSIILSLTTNDCWVLNVLNFYNTTQNENKSYQKWNINNFIMIYEDMVRFQIKGIYGKRRVRKGGFGQRINVLITVSQMYLRGHKLI